MENNSPSATAQMLIRKNTATVFNAFIDPEITKQFWFTKGSGNLELNKEITWTWEMYNVSAKVIPTELIPNSKITFEWFGNGKSTSVIIDFKELTSEATYVSIAHAGFDETGDKLIETLKDSTGGFTMVLAGLKAWLEHGIQLNLIGDKFPKELRDQ